MVRETWHVLVPIMLMAYRGLTTILLHVVILSYVVTPGVATPGAQEEDQDSTVYTEEWVAHIKGGESHARDVAQEHGFRFVRQVTWVFSKFGFVNLFDY